MKYYSEKLNEVFDTPEALEAAENAVKKSCKHKSCTKTDVNNLNNKCDCKDASKNVEGPTKKQLAANVDEAEEKLKAAYAEYEVAKKQIEELSKTYLESVEAILTPAKEAVKKAEQERYAAIRKFKDDIDNSSSRGNENTQAIEEQLDQQIDIIRTLLTNGADNEAVLRALRGAEGLLKQRNQLLIIR